VLGRARVAELHDAARESWLRQVEVTHARPSECLREETALRALRQELGDGRSRNQHLAAVPNRLELQRPDSSINGSPGAAKCRRGTDRSEEQRKRPDHILDPRGRGLVENLGSHRVPFGVAALCWGIRRKRPIR
jgi:hypothetical protein